MSKYKVYELLRSGKVELCFGPLSRREFRYKWMVDWLVQVDRYGWTSYIHVYPFTLMINHKHRRYQSR